jgi:hypothetical protein
MKTKSKLLSRATLRRPFVVTVAAGAAVAAAACGGRMDEPNAQRETDLVSVNPPPPADCPEAEPAQGDVCGLPSGTECGYRDCMGYPSLTATCGADGTWAFMEVSCNPPPPPEDCPETEPKDGDFCNVDPSETCGYRDCGDAPSLTAVCNNYTWEVTALSCNPPPPPEACPAAEPKAGDFCNVDPTETCGYRDCNGTDSVRATCEKNTWVVLEMSCNPPPPPPPGP